MRPERKGVAIFWPFAFTLRATIAEGGHVLATAAQRRYTTAASVRIEDERPTRTEIKHRLRDHGRTDITGLTYERAGHGLGLMVPNMPSSSKISPRYGVLDVGGARAADEAGRAAAWSRVLAFLARVGGGDHTRGQPRLAVVGAGAAPDSAY